MTPYIQRGARRGPLRWAGQAAALAVLCLSALAALALIVVPFVTGSQTYTVLTSSMAPGYPPGTFIVVQPEDYAALEVGDVVTYQVASGQAAVITHRIVGFTSDQDGNRLLVTKGDNNAVADAEPVSEVQVRGTLLYAVPYVGFVADALGGQARAVATDVLAASLILYGVLTVGRGAGARRRAAETPCAATESGHRYDARSATTALPAGRGAAPHGAAVDGPRAGTADELSPDELADEKVPA